MTDDRTLEPSPRYRRFSDGTEQELDDAEARREMFGDEPEPVETEEDRAEHARWRDLAQRMNRTGER
jgi:hypothetical protein